MESIHSSSHRRIELFNAAMQVTGTPTLVVNGKYRLNNEHQMSADQIIELVKFLVAKETK